MVTQHTRVHVTWFAPGKPGDLRAWRKALAANNLHLDGGRLRGSALRFDVGVEWVENPNDGSFAKAFAFGTASPGEQQSIDSAPGALVLSLPVDLHGQRSSAASLAHVLSSCGALAIRIEESRLGFPIARWIELVDGTDPWSLYRLAVVIVGGTTDATTCGMHVFSLPDARVQLDGETDAAAANELLGALNVYQLAEDPLLMSGHTFAPDARTPKRVLRRWPDSMYPPGHPCHNPFGVWRLGASGETGRPPTQLAFVFMPALAAVLAAAEQKNGKALTRKQVEALTSQAVCMTMTPADAQKLERARGYADLDPERAWEQWQLVRSAE